MEWIDSLQQRQIYESMKYHCYIWAGLSGFPIPVSREFKSVSTFLLVSSFRQKIRTGLIGPSLFPRKMLRRTNFQRFTSSKLNRQDPRCHAYYSQLRSFSLYSIGGMLCANDSQVYPSSPITKILTVLTSRIKIFFPT